jgi:hypothetical protein
MVEPMITAEANKEGIYRHVDVVYAQESKRGGSVCGDFVIQDKTEEATTVAVFDGIGSGIKANIAAHLNSSRLMRMLKEGFSLREAGEKIAASMHAAREGNIPFAAFAVARVLSDGHATILTYEMPAPVFIQQGMAYPAIQRFFIMGNEVVGESHFKLDDGCAILFFSDGVSQAGMGTTGKYAAGWGVKDASTFTDELIKQDIKPEVIPQMIVEQAKKLSGGIYGDDTTAAILTSRPGRTVNILTGPPSIKEKDCDMVLDFMNSPGIKIVCGSTTAEIVSRVSGLTLKSGRGTGSYISPPRYYMNGIDIVTEGAFSLNQLYNILDYDNKMYDRDSCVSEMAVLIKAVDRVIFWVGNTENDNYQAIIFPQLGLFPRKKIIPFIEEKLRKMGKLVVKKEF